MGAHHPQGMFLCPSLKNNSKLIHYLRPRSLSNSPAVEGVIKTFPTGNRPELERHLVLARFLREPPSLVLLSRDHRPLWSKQQKEQYSFSPPLCSISSTHPSQWLAQIINPVLSIWWWSQYVSLYLVSVGRLLFISRSSIKWIAEWGWPNGGSIW